MLKKPEKIMGKTSKRLSFLLLLILLTSIPVKTFSQTTVEEISITRIDDHVSQYKGSVVVLQIFGAYCPYSVKEISVINQLGKAYRNYGLKVIVFSRDVNKYDFVRFLDDASIYFEPIWLTSREHEKIITEIAELGGKYKSAIPYTAVINKGNRIVYQRTGYSGDYNTYAAWIEKSLSEKYIDPLDNEIPPSQWEFISSEK